MLQNGLLMGGAQSRWTGQAVMTLPKGELWEGTPSKRAHGESRPSPPLIAADERVWPVMMPESMTPCIPTPLQQAIFRRGRKGP